MNSNPKLSKAPLVESIFELRFDPTVDYSFLVKEISTRLGDDVLEIKTLIPDQVPDFPDQTLIRHRLVLKNDEGLIQLGRGILSINRLKYDCFSSFLTFIQKILNIFGDYETKSIVRRFGLRYINKISLTKDWKDILSIYIKPPSEISSGLDSVYYKFVTNKGSNGFMQVVIANPIKQEITLKDVVIDLDYSKIVNGKFDSNEISMWVVGAHQGIYDTFIACLNPQFKKELE